MGLNLTGVFRKDAVEFDVSIPPSDTNPGGGVAVLLHNIKKALPKMEVGYELSASSAVSLIDSLWFLGVDWNPSEHNFVEKVIRRIEEYVAHDSFKMLLLSDFEFMRWRGEERERIFDASDVVCGVSQYMCDCARAYSSNVKLLTNPIDTLSITPRPKRANLVSAGQVNAEKRIDSLMDIYDELKDTQLELDYIGSNTIWGKQVLDDTRDMERLESRIQSSCDHVIPSLSLSRVGSYFETSWGYVSDSGYDCFSYSMAMAMLAGCWCFCGSHKLFDERPTAIRFRSVPEAIETIQSHHEMYNAIIDEAGRQFVIDNYSIDVFRQQFHRLVGGGFL